MKYAQSTALADDVAVVLKSPAETLHLTLGALATLIGLASKAGDTAPVQIGLGQTTVSGPDSARISAALHQIVNILADDDSPFSVLLMGNPDDALFALALFTRQAAETGFIVDCLEPVCELAELPINRSVVVTLEDN